MKELKVAILIKNKEGLVPESFIKNHIDRIGFEKIVIYGSPIPYKTYGNNNLNLKNKIKFRLNLFFKTAKSKKSHYLEKTILKQHLISNQVDVVFAEYVVVGSNSFEVCKELDIPIIATGLGFELSVYKVLEDNRSKYKEFLQYCSAVIIVAKSMQKVLLELNCNQDKIIHSPAGASKAFEEIEPDYHSKQILAVGRFVEKKSPYSTILAFYQVLKHHPEARLVFAGDGPLFELCKDLVNTLKINENVTLTGIISQEQQRQLLKNSSVFVQHSKVANDGDSEGTPVAIVEASSAGLPVVSTLHAGIIDVVVEGETGFLVPEGDIDLMAQKIICLLNDPVLIKNMGMMGKSHIENNFSLDKHIQIIDETILNAVK